MTSHVMGAFAKKACKVPNWEKRHHPEKRVAHQLPQKKIRRLQEKPAYQRWSNLNQKMIRHILAVSREEKAKSVCVGDSVKSDERL